MATTLNNKTVAFLVTDGFEQVELTKPWDAVKDAGANVHSVSVKSGKVQGVHHEKQGDQFDVDKVVGDVSASDRSS